MSEFSFLVTPYPGFEDEILCLRNRNRSVPKNRAYFDWRYLGQETLTPPEILWVKAPSSAFVGMASLIYRPYWLDNKQYEFMVLGDISLDREYRGTGLADEFFHYMKRHIKNKVSPCALVIPNMAAQKVLERCGWHAKERLVHHVLLLNPEKKIHSYVKFELLSKILSKWYLVLLSKRLRAIQTKGLSITIITKFGEEFDIFWNALDKSNICLRDRSQRSLQWRYGNRPGGESFFIAACHSAGELVAYLVYSINEKSGASIIYELMAINKSYLNGLVKLFVNYIQENFQLDSMRIVLNEKHPYAHQLRKIGFSPRKGGQSIQVLAPDHPEVPLNSFRWLLTAGDKDSKR